MPAPFTIRVTQIISRIPEGSITTYGIIAACAGNPQGARQVARILHACSQTENLPWHRVVNRNGQISLNRLNGYEVQKQLLENEGVAFGKNDTIDLDVFLWTPLAQ